MAMKIELLRDIAIFLTLDGGEMEQVLSITRERRFGGGEIVMEEGGEGDTMYVVLEGEVEVSKSLLMKFGDNDFRETEKVLTRFRPEDHMVFGEMALIGEDTRSATIITMEECRLLEINRSDFLQLLRSSPAIGVKVLLKISELLISRLRRASEDTIRLTTALSIALSK